MTDSQPLATLGWSASNASAKAMKQLPLDFVRCIDCGHIFNRSFDYAVVPYSDHPQLMFNRGKLWANFIRDIQLELARSLPENPVVIEIGYGDGSFLHALAGEIEHGIFIGFDPHGAKQKLAGIELLASLFRPDVDFGELKPNLIVSRHVLEHLTNPLEFLQALSLAATTTGHTSLAYFEVPCVDRLLETGRTVDLYYEHGSQFTTLSFNKMLEKAGVEVLETGYGYDREVIWSIVKIAPRQDHGAAIEQSDRYRKKAERALITIRNQFSDLLKSGKSIAIWGGTGKSAAFINRYGLDADRFPIVVDSDRDKVGTFVPGTGQEILFRDWLKENPVDVILIPPQWRAKDIMLEMKNEGIECETVLIEHGGRMIDFTHEPHPYKNTEPKK